MIGLENCSGLYQFLASTAPTTLENEMHLQCHIIRSIRFESVQFILIHLFFILSGQGAVVRDAGTAMPIHAGHRDLRPRAPSQLQELFAHIQPQGALRCPR